jgi:hypothetical protein
MGRTVGAIAEIVNGESWTEIFEEQIIKEIVPVANDGGD